MENGKTNVFKIICLKSNIKKAFEAADEWKIGVKQV